MQTPDFYHTLIAHAPGKITRRWLYAVVATLAISGLGPLVLLAGRASSFADKELVKRFFHDALVVHVDLSAVAWFLGLCLFFWVIVTDRRESPMPFLRGATLSSFCAGCLCIAFSPLLRDGAALMSNYIPVYTSPLFFLGLGLLTASLILGLLDLLLSGHPTNIFHWGIIGSAYIVLLALVHFAWSYFRLPAPAEAAQDYYELLFWAGGHILQFAYAQLLLIAWIWLAVSCRIKLPLPPKFLAFLFLLYPLVASFSPLAFLNGSLPYDLYFFTAQMRHGGGLATGILGILLIYGLFQKGKPVRSELAAWTCLVTSLIVFIGGGIIGFLIQGSNTIIPAHYHGSIVGTTVAFMGVFYLILPHLELGGVLQRKLTVVQPLLYGGGSLLHMIGFAIAGGHGVARKTAGALQEGQEAAVAALQLARLGGLLAVIGGGLFVALVVISYRKRQAIH